MTIDIDGRRYGEDDLVQVTTGRPRAPYVFIATDGSGVFVARRERRRTRVYRADRPGLEALATHIGWPWLLPALDAADRP
jgi:hypothetical protein